MKTLLAIFWALRIRWDWYKFRKGDGYPISLFRAFFTPYPRFGCYDLDEPGCKDWIKKEWDKVNEL